MSLHLRTVPAPRGGQWLRQAFGLFRRQPVGFTALFAGYLLGTMVVGMLPFIGWVLSLASVPLLTLAFVAGARGALQGERVTPALLLLAFRAPPAVRRHLLLLCALFGAAMVAVVQFTHWVGGPELETALKALSRPGLGAADVIEAMRQPALVQMSNWLTVLTAVVSVPFWHAPPLVLWGGQSAAQSLFSSTLALWRTKTAFAVYMLYWLAAMLAASVVTALAALALAATGLAVLLAALGPALFAVLSAVFYTSLWFIFDDSFADDGP